MKRGSRCNYCGMPLGEQDCNEALKVQSWWNPLTRQEERRLVSAGLMHATPCLTLFSRQQNAGGWVEPVKRL